MEYYAIYLRHDESSFFKSHIGFEEEENGISVKLEGNPYEAFYKLPEFIEENDNV